MSNINETRKKITADTYGKHGPFQIKSSGEIKMVYGTDIPRDIPPTIYIRAKTRLLYNKTIEKITSKDVELLKNKMMECIDTVIKDNPHFENRYLSNMELSTKNVSEGKPTFLRYDIFLRPVKLERMGIVKPLAENLGRTIERRISKLANTYGLCFKQ